jgi:hypothetical protein
MIEIRINDGVERHEYSADLAALEIINGRSGVVFNLKANGEAVSLLKGERATFHDVTPPTAPKSAVLELAWSAAVHQVLLEDLLAYFDDRQDVLDGDSGPRPNVAMDFYTRIEAALQGRG